VNETSSPPPGSEPPSRPPIEPVPLRVPTPPPAYPHPYAPVPSKGRSLLGRFFISIVSALLLGSLVLNIYLYMFVSNVTSGAWETSYEGGDSADRIAVLPIEGVIDEGKAQFVHDVAQHVLANPPKALILRIDSGGGGVGASDRIWHELERLRLDPRTETMPIVASFGSMAASGGYYVAAHCNAIVAEPTTLTGSIGVIAPFMEISDLLTKIGVTPEVVIASESPQKDVGSAIRKWRPEDRTRLTEVLDHAHKKFKEIVRSGRQGKLKLGIDVLGDGSIFTADEAYSNGLVDQLGYLDDAIKKAASLADLGEDASPSVTIFRAPYGVGLLNLVGGQHAAFRMPTADEIRTTLWALTEPHLAYRVRP